MPKTAISPERGGQLSASQVPLRASLPLLFGLAVGFAYALFALLAALHYPTEYSPWHNNTLSQLGNPNLNPRGAEWYLIGCAVAGSLVIAFFSSLTEWRSSGTRMQNRLLLVMQAAGVAGGFGLIMNAVFPENQLPAHHFWAGVVFNGLGAAILLAPPALWRSQHRNIRVLGVAAASVTAIVLMFVFAGTHWVEWVPVCLFLVVPAFLGLHTRQVAASAAPKNRVIT